MSCSWAIYCAQVYQYIVRHNFIYISLSEFLLNPWISGRSRSSLIVRVVSGFLQKKKRKKGSFCLLSVDMNSLWCSHQLCWFCSRTQLTRDLRGHGVWILSTPEELWVTTKTHDTALCWSVYQCDLTVIQCNLRVISVWSQLSPICYTRKSFEKNRFRGMLSFTVFIFAGKCGLQQN